MRSLGKRITTGLRWRSDRSKLEKKVRHYRRLARRMGFVDWMDQPPAPEPALGKPKAKISFPPRSSLSSNHSLAGASVCTTNHVHFARTLTQSFRRCHPQAELFVLVVDAEPGRPPEIEGAQVLTGADIGFPTTPYRALELDACELCCVAKPHLLQFVLGLDQFEKLVYLDSDILVCAPLDQIEDRLDQHDFVITPHLFSPFHRPENAWERPHLGEIAGAGIFNAGMFGLKRSDRARTFLEQWTEMVEAPTAFSPGEHEQHAFNWLPCFADSVHVLKDPAYNVAYWNLHERSLDVISASGSSGPYFSIEGKPLVAFHFSGFDPLHPTRLSRFDQRHNPYHHGPLAKLLEHYSKLLSDNDSDGCASHPYRFSRFPSGISIDSRMRKIFKTYTQVLSSGPDPWTTAGEAHYCRALLLPIPGSGSLLPILLHELFHERHDLQALAPNSYLDPLHLIRWFSEHGALENGYSDIFDRHRPSLPTWAGLEALETSIRESPTALCGDIELPLSAGRSAFTSTYRGQTIAHDVLALRHERYALSPLSVIKSIVDENEELVRIYPDLLFSDAERFTDWLRNFGRLNAFLPSAAVQSFVRTCKAQSLARIYALMSRHWPMMEKYPLALIGLDRDQFAVDLLLLAGRTPEFDIDDIIMYRWLMEIRPSCGLQLVLSLPFNSSRYDLRSNSDDQEKLLGPVLDDPRFRLALQEHQQAARGLGRSTSLPTRPRVWHVVESQTKKPIRSRPHSSRGGTPRGVNVFGYFKSPIGLGSMTRGLESALDSAGVAVARTTVPHAIMDTHLVPDDFALGYDDTLTTNIFVSFPHIEEHLLKARDRSLSLGRQNIAYLAWEMEEVHHLWELAYRDFDHVWALSDFAAKALSTGLSRPVGTVPCVVDTTVFPSPVSKEYVGLPANRFVVLHVFDPGSSIERKNPYAVIDAFARTFGKTDRAHLAIRVANYQPSAHRRALRRLIDRANRAGVDLELITKPLSRTGILQLISACDTYISLHRTEGFGLTCAEAMAYGKPTIATGYSGNLTFMDERSSFLVEYERVEVRIPDGPFRRGSTWAEPSVDHAAHCLRAAYEKPGLVRSLGRAASARIRELLSPRRVGKHVAKLLDGDDKTANVLPMRPEDRGRRLASSLATEATSSQS